MRVAWDRRNICTSECLNVGESGEFQNGNLWYTPGSFRKSGKQRTYRIRNLEE